MKRILLLEDDFTLLRLYSDILEEADYYVKPATTLQAVQNIANLQNIDLCISDLNVGLVSGEIVLNTLAQLQRQCYFPVLAISGYMYKYQRICDILNFHTLEKPFKPGVLLEMVQKLINEKSKV